MKFLNFFSLLVLIILLMSIELLSQNQLSSPQYLVNIDKDKKIKIIDLKETPFWDQVIKTVAENGQTFPVDSLNALQYPDLENYTAGGSNNYFFYDEYDNAIEVGTSVRNMGAATSGPCHILWYLSGMGYMTKDSYILGEDVIPSLVPFGYPNYEFVNLSCYKSLDVFNDIPVGLYFVGWLINSQMEIMESDFNDNMGFFWDYFPLAPNLTFDDQSAGNNTFEYNSSAQTCIFDYKVINKGPAMAGEFRIGFYLTRDENQISDDAILIRSITCQHLYARDDYDDWIQIPLIGFENVQSGKFYGAIHIDDLNKVTELQNNDNKRIFENGFNWTSTLSPLVNSIYPNQGENTGTVNISNLAGSGFDVGARVFLRRPGYTDIEASNVVVHGVNKISCKFDLTDRHSGKWNVIVRNSNGNGSGSSGAELFTVIARELESDIIYVTTTRDSVSGSLRQAIEQANTHIGADTIKFEIPLSDSGLDTSTGAWTIKPESKLPPLTDDSTFIDGNSQSLFSDDLNDSGPEILLKGVNAGDSTFGLVIQSSWNVVQGLIINSFNYSGILIDGTEANYNMIINNYIGANARADEIVPNGRFGVHIANGSHNSIGFIEFTDELKASTKGIMGPRNYTNRVDNEVISYGNIIAGNLTYGILIYGPDAGYNQIVGNNIVANFDDGIRIGYGASNNVVFFNAIGLNQGNGVVVSGESSINNTISINSICANELKGISLSSGNLMLASPVIHFVNSYSIMGTAPPNSSVELYADQEDEGEIYLGNTQTNEYGEFNWSGFLIGPNITAIAIDQEGNTSEFSAPYPFNPDQDLCVTTTNDQGEGSLRAALEQANTYAGPNTITFQIPVNDANFDQNTGVWTIRPETLLPEIIDPDLVINGYSQSTTLGVDVNPVGPEIEIDGSLLAEGNCFTVSGSGTAIAGLVINRFPGSAITTYGVNGGLICGCHIGTDATGRQCCGNGEGIRLSNHTRNFLIGPPDTTLTGNVISGNTSSGVVISDSSSQNYITSNIIGLGHDNEIISEGNYSGIFIISDSDSNHIEHNIICNNRFSGIIVFDSNDNAIWMNEIGTDKTLNTNLGNHDDGVQIMGKSRNNMILENYIGFNKSNGIQIKGANAIRNCCSRNLITKNEILGIKNTDGGNTELSSPMITSVDNNQITGNSGAYQTIEIFADEENQGKIFLGETMSDASGDFIFSSMNPVSNLLNITAVAIDSSGNTSEFCEPVMSFISNEKNLSNPAKFCLYHNYPNPFNQVTKIEFDVAASSRVIVEIFDIEGKLVKKIVDSDFSPGHYQIDWNGENKNNIKTSSGIYLYRLIAGDKYQEIKSMVLLK